MKKVILAAALAAALVLPGCPIYSDESVTCTSDYDCGSGMRCDEYSGVCYRPDDTTLYGSSCTSPADCAVNETCSADGWCVVGDCSFPSVGCVRGYQCGVVDGAHACVPTAGTGGSGGESSPGDAGAGAGGVTAAGAGGVGAGAGAAGSAGAAAAGP
jgi:hypothetical protein